MARGGGGNASDAAVMGGAERRVEICGEPERGLSLAQVLAHFLLFFFGGVRPQIDALAAPLPSGNWLGIMGILHIAF